MSKEDFEENIDDVELEIVDDEIVEEEELDESLEGEDDQEEEEQLSADTEEEYEPEQEEQPSVEQQPVYDGTAEQLQQIAAAVSDIQLKQQISEVESALKVASWTKAKLEADLQAAVEDADFAKVKILTQQTIENEMSLLRLDEAKKQLTGDEAVKKRAADAEEREFKIANDGFVKRNKWFSTDKAAAQSANTLFLGLVSQGMARKDAVLETERQMNAMLGNQKRVAKKPPAKPQDTQKGVVGKEARGGAMSYANLKPQSKRDFAEFYSQGKHVNNNLTKTEAWKTYKTYLTKDDFGAK